MRETELQKAKGQAQALGLSAWPRRIGGQRILEIKTPGGVLRHFWSFDQWAEYHAAALDLKRKKVAVV